MTIRDHLAHDRLGEVSIGQPLNKGFLTTAGTVAFKGMIKNCTMTVVTKHERDPGADQLMWGPLVREFVVIFQEGVAALPGELPRDFDCGSPCIFPPWISQCIGPGPPEERAVGWLLGRRGCSRPLQLSELHPSPRPCLEEVRGPPDTAQHRRADRDLPVRVSPSGWQCYEQPYSSVARLPHRRRPRYTSQEQCAPILFRHHHECGRDCPGRLRRGGFATCQLPAGPAAVTSRCGLLRFEKTVSFAGEVSASRHSAGSLSGRVLSGCWAPSP